MFQRGALKPGERLLVHGGTSGIGTMAIQLAHALESIVYATAGTEAKCAACRRLGAAAAINYRETDFVQAVHRETNNSGVDVVLDIMGGDYFPRNLECLAMDGRLVQIGLLGGARSAVDLRRVMQCRLTITGSRSHTEPSRKKRRSRARSKPHVWPLLSAGRVAQVIDRTFLDGGLRRSPANGGSEHIGKLVAHNGGR